MLIWKKGSVIAASSSNFFRRTQHLQPAAVFSSLLSGLQQTVRQLIAQRFSKRSWPAAALQQAHNNALLRSGFFAPAHQPHPLACSGMQALGVMQLLCGFRSNPHGARAGGVFPSPRFVSQGRLASASLLREFSSFMVLHRHTGAGPCIVSGSFSEPEVFLVS